MGTRVPYETKITFKIDIGKNDLGKTVISNKTFENVNRDCDKADLVTLSEMVNALVQGNGCVSVIYTEQDELY